MSDTVKDRWKRNDQNTKKNKTGRTKGDKENERKKKTQLVSAITHLFAEFARYILPSLLFPHIIQRTSCMNPGARTRNYTSMLMKVVMQVLVLM